jgi:propanol-preferring alcohol dehydrogenase
MNAGRVANMTRSDARDFLDLAAEIQMKPKVTTFTLDDAREALAAICSDSVDGATVIVP